eukprot:gnl/TRDRNA2_/TRDRNA2_174828_c7_seq21.p1 gnl/TRDRNA2_/TRDRNA2_174828_c7~~gnl/TRDRNA2_/TRDRNA2_174828_c7_seq21.p1  ORF type:complete len:498 (-),score=48.52 gnl/TRDRNA2_/TRDRNA2_174828_c7_seq21:79-1572(-)
MVSAVKSIDWALCIFLAACLSLPPFSDAQQEWTSHGCPNPVFEYMKSDVYVPINQVCADSSKSSLGQNMFTPCSVANVNLFVEHLLYQPLSSSWQHRLAGYGPIKSGDKCLGINNDSALEGLGFANSTVDVWWQNCTCINGAAEESTLCTGKQLLKQRTSDNNGFGIWTFQRNNLNSAATDTAEEDFVEHCLAYRSHNATSNGTGTTTNGTLFVKANCSGGANVDHHNFFRIQCASIVMRNDPEVVNLKGEHFKVATTGGVTLLHIPREAPTSRATLVMVGDIEELEGAVPQKNCTPGFLRHLLITGTSLGELTALTFHARNNSSPFVMGFGNHLQWISDGNITQDAISEYTDKIGLPRDVSIAVNPGTRPGSPKEIRVQIGAVAVVVSRPQTRGGGRWPFLNLRVNGLQTLQQRYQNIGGALGFDSPPSSSSSGGSKQTCLSSSRTFDYSHQTRKHARVAQARQPVLAHVQEAKPVSTLQEVAIRSDSDYEATDDV